jgi:hypothetical protein
MTIQKYIYIYIAKYMDKKEFSGKTPCSESIFNVIKLQKFFKFVQGLQVTVQTNLNTECDS